MGPNPLQMLVALRAQQSAPIGPNQGLGAPQLGAPPASATPTPVGAGVAAASPMPDGRHLTNTNQQDVLASFGNRAVGGGDERKLAHHLNEIGRMYPKLKVAANQNGNAEMVGPAQQQFLAAAYARAHGAKVAHVRNNGRGQRLHLRFE